MMSNLQYQFYNTAPLFQQQQINMFASLLCQANGLFVYPDTNKRVFDQSDNHYYSNTNDVAMPPASKKRKLTSHRPTKVRFSDKQIVAVEDVSAWHNTQEIASFKRHAKQCVYHHHTAAASSQEPLDEFCIRGLENVLSPQAAIAQKKQRKERITAVLYQQQIQRETGSSNPELLKQISSLCSTNSCEDAVRRAGVWHQEEEEARA